MPTLPPVVVEYKAKIDELKSKLGEARAEIQETQNSAQSTSQKIGSHLGTMATAIGGSMALVGGFATEMAAKLSTSNADLEAAVDATGHSMEEYKSQIAAADKTGQHFGKTSDDTNEALAKLTRITGDAGKALQDMHLVTEVAAAKHISLSDAADMVGKMTMGNSKVFKQFGVDLDANKGATDKLTAAQKEETNAGETLAKAKQKLADLTAIQGDKTKLTTADHIAMRNAQDAVTQASEKLADAHKKVADRQADVSRESGNLDAKMAEVQKRLGDTAENQANTFHGKISAMTATLKDLTSQFGEKFGPALMGIGALMPVITAGFTTTAFAIGSVELPIIAVIAALAVIGVAIYEVWTHWDTIWGWIKGAISGAWLWIHDNIGFIAGLFGPAAPLIGGIRLLWDNWSSIWGWIKGAVSDAWDVIQDVLGKITGAVRSTVDTINSIPGVGVLKTVGGGIGNAVGSLFRAGGGPVAMNTPYLVGEHGPELFVPTGAGSISNVSSGGMVSVGQIVVNGSSDPAATAAAVRDELLRLKRRNINGGLL